MTALAGVFTHHNNLSRDGSNPSEYALTTSIVTAATFGKLFSCVADGAIYTQPLWVANLTIGSAKHNVVFIATQHESLYAFDADASHQVVDATRDALLDRIVTAYEAERVSPGRRSGGGSTGAPVKDPPSRAGRGC